MQIWPESASLSENGLGSSGGGASAGGAGGGLGQTSAPNAGEIMLSRAETAAIAAMELEDDEDHGLRRAQAESGLDRQQLSKLKRRMATATQKGYTLKGPNFIKKPLAALPDEPGLTRKAVKGDDADEAKPKKPAEKKPAAKTKEANVASFTRVSEGPDLYTCPEMASYGFPQPQSEEQPEAGADQRETNTMTTLASMLRRNRQRRG